MQHILELAFSFPLVVFSVLLSLVALYWLLVLLRVMPVEIFERDSLRDDHLPSTFVSLGFAGVPASFALTVLLLLGAGITLAVELLALRWLDLGLYRIPLGVGIIWASLAIASPIAAVLCRGMHRYFHRHDRCSRRCLLGERVTVRCPAGCAEHAVGVVEDGSEFQVKLHGKPDAMLTEGEQRILVKYLPQEGAYRSVAVNEYLESHIRLRRLKMARSAAH
ncbi:hypothetical protein R5M92_01555 [Halomonas sp. Bachu 37]|uniref:hypothetical protein n=1 Tax=Halomonas kashgarensis TaxID=3084920 RepID=UPI0032177294